MSKGLTKSGIDWVQFGWPIITGCKNKCSIDGEIYCYAYNAVTKGRLKGHPNYNPNFSPKFNPQYLDAPLQRKKPATIFVAPLGEVWGKWVPVRWQIKIMDAVREASQHTFFSLTKSPGEVGLWQYRGTASRGVVYKLPDNLWIGASITGTNDPIYGWNFERERPLFLSEVEHDNRFLSFEPLLADVTEKSKLYLEGIRWVIIGGLSKGAVKINPPRDAFMKIYSAAQRAGIPIFVKDNCIILSNPPKEYPEGF